VDDERSGIEAGAIEYFTKPLDMDRLIARMREILAARAAAAAAAPA
jgi:DNA-binding response OmpR family regulator